MDGRNFDKLCFWKVADGEALSVSRKHRARKRHFECLASPSVIIMLRWSPKTRSIVRSLERATPPMNLHAPMRHKEGFLVAEEFDHKRLGSNIVAANEFPCCT
jgi:hypothetical protein